MRRVCVNVCVGIMIKYISRPIVVKTLALRRIRNPKKSS